MSFRRVLAPIFAAWKWFFKSAVAKAELVMAVSDSFIQEASHYASDRASVKRFYIGHERLISAAQKQSIFTIAYVGNLGRLYDFDTLLDVLAEAELRNHVQLFVIGKGDRQEWLIGELERRKLHYRFLAQCLSPSVLRTSCEAATSDLTDTLIQRRHFSYKATTYFAAGLPIINSMTGDLQYLVKKHGWAKTTKQEIARICAPAFYA